ncbi:hypothetical protein Tco_1230044 [Tanacetum coccineum]
MVGATTRVDSSKEKEVLGEDASKHGRSDNVDTLFSGQDEEMLNVGEEVVVVEEINERRNVVDEVAEVIKTAQVSTASEKVSTASAKVSTASATTTTEDDLTLAQALADLKSIKPKAKGIAFREPGESTTTTTPIPSKIQDKGKGKMVEHEPVKKLSKKINSSLMKRLHLNYKQRLMKRKELLELKKKRLMKRILLRMTFKQKLMLITSWLKDSKRAKEKRNKPLTKTQQKKTMITYLKNMEVWKHKDLKSKDFDSIKELFDKAFKRVNTFVDFRTDLVEGSSKRTGEELE